MPRILGVAIPSLVSAMSMYPEISVKICRHWVTRFSLDRSSVMSGGCVGIILAAVLYGRLKKSHHLLVLIKNLLHNVCSSCCNWW